jgi:hypothetical protein
MGINLLVQNTYTIKNNVGISLQANKEISLEVNTDKIKYKGVSKSFQTESITK